MAVFDQLTIPDEGVALLTSVIANQGTLTVTEMRFSDIDYTGQEHSITAATWAGTFQTVTPSASVHDTTTINVTGSFTNAGYSTSKTLKTVGIVGEDGNGVPTLIGVAVATSYDVIPPQALTPSTFTYSANIVVSSTADIHVSGSQAGALFVADIIDDLNSQDTDKPLSANQGSVLKGLIDNIPGGGSNRNLLDNAWFTVNQMGITSGTSPSSSTLLMDRWKSARTTYSLTSDGFEFAWDGTGTPPATYGYIRQNVYVDDYGIRGKTVTISAIVDGDLVQQTFTYPAGTDYSLVYNLTADIEVDINEQTAWGFAQLFFKNNSQTSHTLRAVKLEEGSSSTLMYDTAPKYAEELLECQRYFVRLPQNFATLGYAQSATEARTFYNLPVPMRAAPQISLVGTASVVTSGGYKTVSALTLDSASTTQTLYLFATTTGLTAGQGVALKVSGAGSYLDITAA